MIYSDIYDITCKNLENSGNKARFSKEAFEFAALCSPFETDILKLCETPENSVFLEKAYLAILQRPIDDIALENWQQRLSMPKHEFQQLVITSLLTSQEAVNCNVRIKNNIFPARVRRTISAPQGVSSIPLPEKLLRIYRRQPEAFKKIVRKIMGVK